VPLQRWVRLSQLYFGLLAAFTAGFSFAIWKKAIVEPDATRLGMIALTAFLVLGLPLVWRLGRAAHHKQPAWLLCLAYSVLALFTGAGAWLFLGYLTYLASKKLKQGS
jgi:hypothetical protein